MGRLEFDEKKITTVSPKIGGWIEELYVDYTGKMVRKGQPLLSIYSPDLVSAQEEFLLALKIKKIYEAQSSAEFSTQGETLLAVGQKAPPSLGHHPQTDREPGENRRDQEESDSLFSGRRICHGKDGLQRHGHHAREPRFIKSETSLPFGLLRISMSMNFPFIQVGQKSLDLPGLLPRRIL